MSFLILKCKAITKDCIAIYIRLMHSIAYAAGKLMLATSTTILSEWMIISVASLTNISLLVSLLCHIILAAVSLCT